MTQAIDPSRPGASVARGVSDPSVHDVQLGREVFCNVGAGVTQVDRFQSRTRPLQLLEARYLAE